MSYQYDIISLLAAMNKAKKVTSLFLIADPKTTMHNALFKVFFTFLEQKQQCAMFYQHTKTATGILLMYVY